MGLFYSRPEFVTVLAKQCVKNGDKITLCCEANTHCVTATWERNNQMLSCVYGKHTVKQEGAKVTLEIKNADESDEGNYTLTVTNPAGSTSCSAMVRIEIEEWRKVTWDQDAMLKKLRTFKISENVKELNFLMYGPVGSGKSSSINTIKSVINKRQFVSCLAATSMSKSQTGKFARVKVANEDGSFPFTFCDTEGVEQEGGVHTEDIISALEGHMREDYTFNPKVPMLKTDLYYNKNPSLNDQMHCLVFVLPADKISVMESSFCKTMQTVRKTASQLGLPQVVFMTRVDCLCPMTKENVKNVYKSRKIQDKILECSHVSTVPPNCIFPVQNYYMKTHMNEEINCLMLDTLTSITNWANDYVNAFHDNKKSAEF